MWQSLEALEPAQNVLKYMSTGSAGLTTNLSIGWAVNILTAF
jgi:hypothetical protein